MIHYQKGFTLVELMIVIVILSILTMVGFVSYEGYLIDTRDSKRLTQLTELRDSMRLAITKGTLPTPDNVVEIRNNGQTFMYQGYAGKNVLDSLVFSENTYDPKDKQFYTYLVSTNKKDFQLLGFLEKSYLDATSFNTSSVFAEDYSQRFPRTVGKKLGVLLQQKTNTPIQELSVFTASGFFDLATDMSNTLFNAYISDTYLISGSGSNLTGIIPYTTCKKILENGRSYGNGYYSINPSGTNPFEVYCDMNLEGGGWTLIARSVVGSNGDFGWLISRGNPRDEASAYSLGDSIKSFGFGEILLSTYTSGKILENAVKISIDPQFLRQSFNNPVNIVGDSTQTISNITCSTLQTKIGVTYYDICPGISFYGKVGKNTNYFFSWDGVNDGGLLSQGYSPHYLYGSLTNYNGITQATATSRQGMIFVR